MKVYKILHKPTGLFFIPSKGRGNLSKTGKIYPKPPQLKWATGSVRIVLHIWSGKKPQKHQQTIIDHFELESDKSGGYWIDKHYKVNDRDWEIVEYE